MAYTEGAAASGAYRSVRSAARPRGWGMLRKRRACDVQAAASCGNDHQQARSRAQLRRAVHLRHRDRRIPQEVVAHGLASAARFDSRETPPWADAGADPRDRFALHQDGRGAIRSASDPSARRLCRRPHECRGQQRGDRCCATAARHASLRRRPATRTRRATVRQFERP